jgi:squalene-hopene/tetraprenyl-beta-curcumene cyclase
VDAARLDRCIEGAAECLLSMRTARGHWQGRLCSSALSTATAVAALHMVDARAHASIVEEGLAWLADHVNQDGGWGDTPVNDSNLAATLVVVSAFRICSSDGSGPAQALQGGEGWLLTRCGGLTPDAIQAALVRRYGRDKTFAVPILAMCAMAGLLGPDEQAWGHVAQLPFEAAVLPHRLLRWVRLGVVSYALPALIAIGLLRHRHRPSRLGPVRWLRNALRRAVAAKLGRIQPESGGFLEAAPLTGFVTMSLCHAGLAAEPVVEGCKTFLLETRRDDGSWPIDTNLATWVTTLSVHALRASGGLNLDLEAAARKDLRNWLLDQQHLRVHPYTQAAPGGWAWTDLSGGVPDADDTAGALLALHALGPPDTRTLQAAQQGCDWLRGVQNSDGGIATFCRGWGRLDFDRSSNDLTAHALRAWRIWLEHLPSRQAELVRRASDRARKFLAKAQGPDGAWNALWFGNERSSDEQNPVFGTARVLLALAEEASSGDDSPQIPAAVSFLLRAQRSEGGWGPEGPDSRGQAPESVEETASGVEALSAAWDSGPAGLDRNAIAQAVRRGAMRLAELTRDARRFPPAPVGLYFARLWYYEQAYPVVMSLSAWARARVLWTQEGV